MTVPLAELRHMFLNWLDGWHAAEGYEPDFRLLAKRLGVRVIEGRSSKYDPYTNTIIIEAGLHHFAERHQGLHELAHHLFRIAEEGAFYAHLQLLTSRKSRQGIEEGLVHEGGLRMLLPQSHLHAEYEKTDSDVEVAVRLAKSRRSSLEVAGRRVAHSLARPIRGMVIDSRGKVVASFGNNIGAAKYVSGRGFTLPETHSLRQHIESDKAIELRATIPFKWSQRQWLVPVELWKDSVRFQTLAFFDGRRTKNRGMTPLFPHLYRRPD